MNRWTKTSTICRPKKRPRSQDPGSLARRLRRWNATTSSCSRGRVYPDVIKTWIDYKRENEVDALRLRPHPYEFCLYYDI